MIAPLPLFSASNTKPPVSRERADQRTFLATAVLFTQSAKTEIVVYSESLPPRSAT